MSKDWKIARCSPGCRPDLAKCPLLALQRTSVLQLRARGRKEQPSMADCLGWLGLGSAWWPSAAAARAAAASRLRLPTAILRPLDNSLSWWVVQRGRQQAGSIRQQHVGQHAGQNTQVMQAFRTAALPCNAGVAARHGQLPVGLRRVPDPPKCSANSRCVRA